MFVGIQLRILIEMAYPLLLEIMVGFYQSTIYILAIIAGPIRVFLKVDSNVQHRLVDQLVNQRAAIHREPTTEAIREIR